MLAISIQLHCHIISFLQCVLVSGLHGSADPQIAGKIQEVDLMLLAKLFGPVRGRIVNDYIVVSWRIVPDILYHRQQAFLFVIGRNNDQFFHARSMTSSIWSILRFRSKFAC